jgi:two-component system response regulator ChvI
MTRRCCTECGTVLDSGETKLARGPLLMDRALRRVVWRGHDIHLTPMEFDTLELLAQREGRVVQGWAFFAADVFDEEVDDKIVDVIICKVRGKFRAVDPTFESLHTQWGEGYRWVRVEGETTPEIDRTEALRERVARGSL